MCLMVWIGTMGPVEVRQADPDPALGYARVVPEPADAPIRRNVPSPFVTYVGSHEGCGCGFNSSQLEFEGFDDESQLAPFVGGLLDSEREEYLAERRSRERLHMLVSAALRDGPVVVYCCWAGVRQPFAPRLDERPSVDVEWRSADGAAVSRRRARRSRNAVR